MNTYQESGGDGYSNEFQRAMAHSRMTTPIRNDKARALALVAEGKTVVLAYSPVYCRVTDAVLGESCAIISVADDYESAVGPVLNSAPDPEERFEVLPHPPEEATPTTEDEGVPF